MRKLLFLGAAALLCEAALVAAPAPSLADDVAEVSTRFCYKVAAGELRWDPSDLQAEKALLESYGLTPGIPAGILHKFGRMTAATFNQSVLGSRKNGDSHVLLAAGGQMPGCRVTIAGAPGVVTAAQLAEALQKAPHGWTAVPELFRPGGPIERHSFLRRSAAGTTMMLDLLVVTEPSGSFRAMTMVLRPPAGLKLPAGF
jgi:hypothetical protein